MPLERRRLRDMSSTIRMADQKWWSENAERLEAGHFHYVVTQDEVVQLLARSVCNLPVHSHDKICHCTCEEWVKTWYSLYHALPIRKRLTVDQLLADAGEPFPWTPGMVRW
jgi:hypothetical protein